FFLATKDETSPILKTFITGLENQLILKVKVIKSDNRTEFKNSDLNQFCGLKGIKREFSVPRTPQQNGIAERKNMTLIEAARTMLADSLLPIPFWAEAVNTACYSYKDYELSNAGNETNPSAGFQDKFDAEKAGEEIDQQYVFFPMWSSGSTNPQNNDEDAVFDGKEHDFDAKKPEFEVILSPSSKFEDCSDNNSNEVNAAGFIVPIVGQNSLNSTNPFSVAGLSNDIVSPTYEKSSFIDASQLPDDLSPIPTTRIQKDHHVSQIIGDLSSTTQTRSMTRVVKDQGFEDPDHPDKVYRVVKVLYGLHQAPRVWYETLATYLLENGFQRGTIDQTLFTKKHKEDILLVQIYVDDIIFGATNKDLCKSIEKLMKDKFQMSSIRDCNEKKLIQVVKIPTENNFADLLTKAFDVGRFQYSVASCSKWNEVIEKVVTYILSAGYLTTQQTSWLVQKQMTLGKDSSNPLMADNLPKFVWYSTHRVTLMKSWLVQKQTALGKDRTNPLTVDSLIVS
nr:putative ribonuclease H-like domain-containing protein [Tanacetum cinerariifolium]